MGPTIQFMLGVFVAGCGWGALAEKAATEFDASVVGVTLSTEQLAFANERMRRLLVDTRADLRLQDYRDIDDQPFDAICSIEMVEAVGREYWPTYFQTVARLLKPGGKACIQSIVIDDSLFERYISSTDFIQQYIFPGGMLPSPGAVAQQARGVGLDVVGDFAFGRDYARTLAHWHRAFEAQSAAVRAQGFPERFLRMWRFYLSYCEAGFETGDIDVHHYVFAHAGAAIRGS